MSFLKNHSGTATDKTYLLNALNKTHVFPELVIDYFPCIIAFCPGDFFDEFRHISIKIYRQVYGGFLIEEFTPHAF